MHLNRIPSLLAVETGPLPDTEFTTITEDSRRVRPGTIFVAAPGVRTDGHDYAAQAVAAGAVAVMGSRTDLTEIAGVPYIQTANPRKALGILAHALAGNPSKDLTVIGITGTNGKSSSVLLTQRVLGSCGRSTAVFGTLGYDIAGTMLPAKHTTPFGEDLAAMFARAKDAGCSHVAMEVSSHSLDQERVAGIDFDVAVFTNLTQDHLDYHVSMDDYCRAKLMLFERLEGPGRFTVVNADDPRADRFVAASRVPCYTFGKEGDCRAENVRFEVSGTKFVARTPWGTGEFSMTLLGHHNVSNALGVITITGGLGIPIEEIARGIASLESVPGRFERVDAGQSFHVVVDYAHTEDGLRNVLRASRDICSGRVIVVFGCGGDRDRTKRPKMGAAAGELGDFAIITSDNPRSEEPLSIIAEIEPGVIATGRRKNDDYLVIPDRAEAIRTALHMAKPGDLVMIAGKGHEDYQILGAERIHFDDREVARDVLERL